MSEIVNVVESLDVRDADKVVLPESAVIGCNGVQIQLMKETVASVQTSFAVAGAAMRSASQELYHLRGPKRGIKVYLKIFTGVEPVIHENFWPFDGIQVCPFEMYPTEDAEGNTIEDEEIREILAHADWKGATIGDDTAGLFTQLVGDPDLVLPESVSDKTSKSSVQSRSKTFRVIVDQTKDMKSPRVPDMGTRPNSGEQ